MKQRIPELLRVLQYNEDDFSPGGCCTLRMIESEARRLMLADTRYEKLHKLNPRQFTQLYEDNIAGVGLFDELVDRL